VAPSPSPDPGTRAGDPTRAGDAARNAVWAALADPTRRRLLDQVSTEGPATATQLAPSYGMTRQAVVKHLATLSGAGLLVAERQGREVRYRIRPEAMVETATWLATVGARWDRRLEALQRQVQEGRT
jgi:DNA-binding transcriptional ArsR family regulator